MTLLLSKTETKHTLVPLHSRLFFPLPPVHRHSVSVESTLSTPPGTLPQNAALGIEIFPKGRMRTAVASVKWVTATCFSPTAHKACCSSSVKQDMGWGSITEIHKKRKLQKYVLRVKTKNRLRVLFCCYTLQEDYCGCVPLRNYKSWKATILDWISFCFRKLFMDYKQPFCTPDFLFVVTESSRKLSWSLHSIFVWISRIHWVNLHESSKVQTDFFESRLVTEMF